MAGQARITLRVRPRLGATATAVLLVLYRNAVGPVPTWLVRVLFSFKVV